jgi:hypothetical protein
MSAMIDEVDRDRRQQLAGESVVQTRDDVVSLVGSDDVLAGRVRPSLQMREN